MDEALGNQDAVVLASFPLGCLPGSRCLAAGRGRNPQQQLRVYGRFRRPWLLQCRDFPAAACPEGQMPSPAHTRPGMCEFHQLLKQPIVLCNRRPYSVPILLAAIY